MARMTDAPPALSAEHRLPCPVYREETDCMGVVYHANYLKYFERGWGQVLGNLDPRVTGLDLRRIDVTFKAPGKLGDTLEVVTRERTAPPGAARAFDQRIECPAREERPLLVAKVELGRLGEPATPVAAMRPATAAPVRASAEVRLPCKVYYEDTDCTGAVHPGNFLKYFERGRSEFLAAHGLDVAEVEQRGSLFMVYRIDATYLAPARLSDELQIVSRALLTSSYRVTFEQRVECPRRAAAPLVQANIELVCVDVKERPIKPIPDRGF